MTTRLSLLLLMAILGIVTLGRAQDATTSTATTRARAYETGEHLQMSASLFDSGKFTTSYWTGDNISRWKVHVALQLVKRRELNDRQQRIFLDALSSSDFGALPALRRRALAAFPKKEAAELFANITGAKADDDLLSLYSDLSALPLKERKAAFRNASSNDKTNLWRTHLALFLVKRPDLDEWQKGIILAAMSLVTPAYFEVRADSPTWKLKVRDPLRSLEQEILGAFSFEDGARIFATLGDDTDAAKRTHTPWGSVSLNTVNYRERGDADPYTHNRFSRQDLPAQRGSCDCSLSSDWCPISGYCNSTGCSGTQSGCGTLWSYPCNGECR
jgi:hypothetical protein